LNPIEPNKTLNYEIGSIGLLPQNVDVLQMQTKCHKHSLVM